MRHLNLYHCSSTREPLLELKFVVCIASIYLVMYSIVHNLVNITQILNNPSRRYYETAIFTHITLSFHNKEHIEFFLHYL